MPLPPIDFMPPVALVLLILWAGFLAWWWIPALRNRTPFKRAPSRFAFLTRIAAIPAALILAAVVLAAPWIATARVFPDSLPVAGTGLFIVILGMGFAVWARLHLGSNWSGRPAIRENHTLTRTGPYAIVRNPIYTGILTGILGTAIATGSVIAFLCFVIILVMFHLKIRMEEEILLEEFGDEYERYRREVKALVPFVL